MLLALVGSSGLGMTWGWLIGERSSRWSRWSLFSGLTLAGSTLLLALQVGLLTDWRALALFLGAAALAFVAHRQWRRELGQRFEPPNP